MDAVQQLLVEAERVQCLGYLARAEVGHPVPTRDLMEALHFTPSRCGTVVSRLTRDGLVRPRAEERYRLPRELELTEAGRAAMREWKASIERDGRG